MDAIALDGGRIREGEVDPVPDSNDLVVLDPVVAAVPQVDAVPAVCLDQVAPAFDPVAADVRPAPRFDVDAVERPGHPAVPNGHAIGFDEDAGHVL